jgi:Coenzyme PQQ synthesis protein D (PqqD)
MQLTINSIVSRVNDDHIISKVGNETVMMNMRTGKYIGLNAMGSEIWRLIEKDIPVGAIVAHLVISYDISPEDCQTQVLQYLQNLLEEKLIKEVK